MKKLTLIILSCLFLLSDAALAQLGEVWGVIRDDCSTDGIGHADIDAYQGEQSIASATSMGFPLPPADDGKYYILIPVNPSEDYEIHYNHSGYSEYIENEVTIEDSEPIELNINLTCNNPVKVFYDSDTFKSNHNTLLNGYNATSNDDLMKGCGKTFPGDLTLNDTADPDKVVKLECGYNCDFLNNAGGTTTIDGNVAVSTGTLILDSGTLQIQ
jgi:hypothetical protein